MVRFLLTTAGDMKKFLLLLAMLLILVGCSTTGKVSLDSQPAENIVSADPAPTVKAAEKTEPLKSEAPTTTVATEPTPLGVRKQAKPVVVEEEDDISKLFAASDFQKFDIPIVFNDAVKYYIGWFTTEKRKVFGNWLKRARRYVPIIKEILKAHGMPEDLVYLAMIESGFNPKAYSTAKACGPWQFIYATGGRYGLTVNNWIDERRDPEKSTVAAAKYLKDLFNQFGCWYLAAAGYNAGERRVERAIEKHNTNDFWELARYNALPRETRQYIPQLIAAAVIAKDPSRFGFGNIVYDTPVKFVEVKVPPATPLSVIAKVIAMDVDDLRAMNPEIIRGITPPDLDNYTVKLPQRTDRARFAEDLEGALSTQKRIKSVVTYKTRRSDTLAKVLKRFKLNAEDLALLNDCGEQFKVKPGMVVFIPRFGSSTGKVEVASVQNKEPSAKKSSKKDRPVKVAKKEKPEGTEHKESQTAYHVVRKGETLAGISGKYGIDVASIKSENNLKGDKVYPNMKLKLVGYQEKKTKAVKYHVVRKGETLASISNKYGTDVATLKSANNLKRDKLVPKMKLKILEVEG